MDNSIIYLDMQGLADFSASDSDTLTGSCYEWENEKVYHIHPVELTHQFGRRSDVIITKGDLPSAQATKGLKFAVKVGPDLEAGACVYENTGEEWAPRTFLPICTKDDLFSRSGNGLLEQDAIAGKQVLVVGLGSGGSDIALELAKTGVNVSLIDYQRLETHNIVRHAGGIKDLGRLKTDVVKDLILEKNPYAQVDTFPVDINENLSLLYDEVEKADLVIVATDGNESRVNAQKALVEKGKIGIFGRAITRAEGGDVFIYRPGGPCYCCAIGADAFAAEEITDETSARRNGIIPAYMSADDARNMVQVGLSSDIRPINNMVTKLALFELTKGTECALASLEEDFKYPLYVWANRREVNFANWHPFYQAGPQKTIMRWYGVNLPKDEGCPICSDGPMSLDVGEDVESLLPNMEYIETPPVFD